MNFNQALEAVLNWEGGYVNDPKDPGGETKYGISKKSYPKLDIKKLTKDKAGEIYRLNYWNACSCDELPAPLALMVFDCAVNCGVGTAGRLLQEALCGLRATVTKDGAIGPKTVAAAKLAPLPRLLEEYAARRGTYYAQLDKLDDRFGLGWMRRLSNIYRLALAAVK